MPRRGAGLQCGGREKPVARQFSGCVAWGTRYRHNARGTLSPRTQSGAISANARRISETRRSYSAGASVTARSGACSKGVAERIYQLDAVTPVVGVPGALRRATEADRALAVAWAVAFQREALGDDDPRTAARMVDARLGGGADSGLYVWDDGQPVSLAGYSGPTPHGIRVGPVYTPPAHRGKGYASACVAALSQLLLDGGRAHCFLFTDLGNPTSNHIYQAIGYQPVCDVDEYRFL